VCTAAAGVSLYVLYLLSVAQFLGHLDFSSVTALELLIVVTQALRVVGVAAYYRARPVRADVFVILFSFETFVVLGLILTSLATSDPSYGQFAGTIYSTWVAAFFTILPSYVIFASVVQMRRGRGLVPVLLPIGFESGLLVYFVTTLLGSSGTFSFARFFDYMISASVSNPSPRAIPALSALPVLAASVALYCSLLVYATIPTVASVVQPRVNFVLPLLGAAVSLVWVYAAILTVPNSLLSFAVPGFALVAVLWLYMRR
jgi:hypothetical protein